MRISVWCRVTYVYCSMVWHGILVLKCMMISFSKIYFYVAWGYGTEGAIVLGEVRHCEHRNDTSKTLLVKLLSR